jgi:hypothetical protein
MLIAQQGPKIGFSIFTFNSLFWNLKKNHLLTESYGLLLF